MFNFSRISPSELQKCASHGWIPGPKETEEAFVLRIESLKHFYSNPPAECDQFLTDTDWREPLEMTKALYGMSPDWIVAYYSDAKLPFYQGAATWILEKKGTRLPLIQLKKRFSDGQSRLRSDILSHEAVHASRLQFDEPYFEEHFAYCTSRNIFRRFFGPLFQKNWESLVFVLLFFLPLLSEIGRYYAPNWGLWDLFFWLPWAFTGALLARLLICNLLFVLARRRTRQFKIPKGKELAFMLHLTDREILKLAIFPKNRVFKKDHSLRWKQILSAFSFEMPKGS